MSQAVPSGRRSARWSLAAHAAPPPPDGAGLPASMAGLPSVSPCVCVKPPLSANTPSLGSTPVRLLAVSPVMSHPVVLPMRLWPCDVSAEEASQSGLGGVPAKSMFPATIVFRRTNAFPKALAIPPPWPRPAVPLVLLVIVTLFSSVEPFCSLETPPPLLPLWLSLMVELTTVNVPLLSIPPPRKATAVLPVIELPVIVTRPLPLFARPPPLPPIVLLLMVLSITVSTACWKPLL